MLFENKQKFNSWKEFVGYLTNIQYEPDVYYWRGQGNANWPIVSSLMRWINGQNVKGIAFTNTYASKYYVEVLKHIPTIERHIPTTNVFDNNPILSTHETILQKIISWKKKIEAHYQPIDYFGFFLQDKGSNFDCSFGFPQDISNWIWAQHYGIRSLLVDWTRFPLYALFFALEGIDLHGDPDATYCVAIYRLCERTLNHFNTNDFITDASCYSEDLKERNKSYYRKISSFYGNDRPQYMFSDIDLFISDKKTSNYAQEEISEYIDVLRDVTRLKLLIPQSQNNDRLFAQGGLFTFTPFGLSIEDWIIKRERMFKTSDLYQLLEKNTPNNGKIHTPLLDKFTIQFSAQDIDDCYIFLENNKISAKYIYPDFEGTAKQMKRFEHNLSKFTTFNENYF